MPFTRIRDIRLYHETGGSTRSDAPRLLYISGTGGDLRTRPNIFDTPLIRTFALAAFDQRGLGQTAKPDIPYRMADYAMDAAALLDHLGWESCHVLGESFGGMVAQELALDFPHKVTGLVLACTSSGGAGGDSYPLHKLGDVRPPELVRTMLPLLDSRCDEAWQDANPEAFRQMAEQMLNGLAFAADDPLRRTGARRQIEARIGHDTYARLPTIACPTLVCAGKYDQVAPLQNLTALADRIPGAELAIFEGGHYFLRQDPAGYRRVTEFLTGLV